MMIRATWTFNVFMNKWLFVLLHRKDWRCKQVAVFFVVAISALRCYFVSHRPDFVTLDAAQVQRQGGYCQRGKQAGVCGSSVGMASQRWGLDWMLFTLWGYLNNHLYGVLYLSKLINRWRIFGRLFSHRLFLVCCRQRVSNHSSRRWGVDLLVLLSPPYCRSATQFPPSLFCWWSDNFYSIYVLFPRDAVR